MKDKIIISLLGVTLAIFCCIYCFRGYLSLFFVKQIEDNFQTAWCLDKKFIDSLSFKMAEEQGVGGTSEKYLLTDDLNNKWLFKVGITSNLDLYTIEETVSKLAMLIDVNLPRVHTVSFNINDKIVTGSLQRIMAPSKALGKLNFNLLRKKQLKEVFKLFILDSFVLMPFDEIEFLLLDRKNEIFGIDKDEAIISDSKDSPLLPENKIESWVDCTYKDLFLSYIKNHAGESYMFDSFLSAKLLSQVSSDVIVDIFKPITDSAAIKKELKTELFYKNESDLTDKKNMFFDEVADFYKRLSIQYNWKNNISSAFKTNLYYFCILKKQKKLIIDLLKQIKNRKKIVQPPLYIISSPRCWFFCNDMNDMLCEKEVLDNLDTQVNLLTVINKLKKMRIQENCIYEKLAVTFYILKIAEVIQRDGKDAIDRIDEQDIRVTLHPKMLNKIKLRKRYLKFNSRNSVIDGNQEWEIWEDLVQQINEQISPTKGKIF